MPKNMTSTIEQKRKELLDTFPGGRIGGVPIEDANHEVIEGAWRLYLDVPSVPRTLESSDNA